MNAIGSRMVFSVVTIDQPGKQIAKGLHGIWMAPDQSLQAPGAALFVGTNPIESQGRSGAVAALARLPRVGHDIDRPRPPADRNRQPR